MTRYDQPSSASAGSHWYLFALQHIGETYLFSTWAGHTFVGTFSGVLDNGTLHIQLENGQTSFVNPKAIAYIEDGLLAALKRLVT